MPKRRNFVDVFLSLEANTLQILRDKQRCLTDAWGLIPTKHLKLPFFRIDNSFNNNNNNPLDINNPENFIIQRELASLPSPSHGQGHFTLRKINITCKEKHMLVVVEMRPSRHIEDMRKTLMLRLQIPQKTINCAWNPYIVLGTIRLPEFKDPESQVIVHGYINGIFIQNSQEKAKSKRIYLPSPGDISIHQNK